MPPTSEPVSLDEAKRHVHAEDFDDDDGYLQSLVSAARDHVEKYCNAKFTTQTVEIRCDEFCDFSNLPFAQTQDVVSIKYIDTNNVEQTLSTDVYELREDAGSIVLKYNQQWPAKRINSRVTLTAIVGFAECPPAVKHAILLRVGDLYEYRESEPDKIWTAFDSLLSNYRYWA